MADVNRYGYTANIYLCCVSSREFNFQKYVIFLHVYLYVSFTLILYCHSHRESFKRGEFKLSNLALFKKNALVLVI